MSTATETAPACTPVRKGCLLPCPRCGQTSAITLNLDDIHGDEALKCYECDVAFGVEEIRNIITRWVPIVAWADQFPVNYEEE